MMKCKDLEYLVVVIKWQLETGTSCGSHESAFEDDRSAGNIKMVKPDFQG